MVQSPPFRNDANDLSAMLLKAAQLHGEGKSAEAEIACRLILARDPRHFEALHLLGILKYGQGDLVEARRRLSEAVKARDTDANAQSNLATVLAILNDPSGALSHYEKALAIDARHDGALNGRGNVLVKLKRLEAALESFDLLLAVAPHHLDALNNRGVALAALRRYPEALADYDRALALRPGYVEALGNRGDALKELGRLDEALASYDKALELQPQLVTVLNNRGNVLMALQRPLDALASFDRALIVQPGLFEVINNRGIVLRRLGRAEEALASFDRAVALKPDYAEALNNRGVALRDLKRPEEAVESYDRALACKPGYVEALNNRGVELRRLGRLREALADYDAALALRPDDPEALNNRGNLMRDLHRAAGALVSYDAAIAARPDYAEAFNNRAGALKDLMRPEEALASYEMAIALKPDYAEAHDNRGLILTTLGLLPEASAAIERAIELAPDRIRAYYNLTEVRRMKPGDMQLHTMEALARDMSALSVDERIELQFALGKACADIGDHERSFRFLLDANALKRSQNGYDEAANLDVFARTRAGFTADVLTNRQGLGDPSATPVFILGMPRSGTTLVEQILASHPDVFGAGEIGAFGDIIRGCLADGLSTPTEDRELAGLSAAKLRQLGAVYLAELTAYAPGARRITNKTPGNFFFAGLIHLALPNARIVHVRRDPADTCLSCFSKLFVNEHYYAYDLAELGRYYTAYEGLMAHWRQVLPPGVMLEVQYEEVVADLEGQSRRILEHCGVDWDPRCLDFHLTERAVSTASATQVRQPLYQSSVGKWRRYEAFLGPLLAQIGHISRQAA